MQENGRIKVIKGTYNISSLRMANLYTQISIMSIKLLEKEYKCLNTHIFINTYMPNVQCLYTSIVLHTSFTYTHKIMNRHIHMHTYIYAHYAYIHTQTYAIPCVNGCTHTPTPELTNMHAKTYDQITRTWLYTYANIHI